MLSVSSSSSFSGDSILDTRIVNPLSPEALQSSGDTPLYHDVYVNAPIMVPAPVVYTPPVIVTHVPPPPPPPAPVIITHVHPQYRRPPNPVVTGAVTGAAVGVATVAVADCCGCW